MLKEIGCFVLLVCFGSTRAITGGELAKEGEFPFVVSIRDSSNCHICGGTIIGDKWILTANICYSRAWFGSVRFGSTKLNNNCGEYDNATQIKTADVQYNPWASNRVPFTHDLVLIYLNESIPFSDNVQPVELPVLDETWPYNQTATILGWANSEYQGTDEDLHKAEIPLFWDEYCINPLLYNGWTINNPFVMKCGGEVGEAYYCRYDYGGPLMYGGKQFGIISYLFTTPGEEVCGQYPGIYSPVSYFRNWIQLTTGI